MGFCARIAVMDNKSGGQAVSNSLASQKPQAQTSAEKQRETAINLARQQVLNAYKKQPQNYRPATANEQAHQYNQVTPQINEAEWRKYHSAWQKYYQQYYGDYYNKAATQYIAQEKIRLESEQIEKAEKERKEFKEKVAKEHKRISGARLALAAEKSSLAKEVESLRGSGEINEKKLLENDFRAKIRRKVEKRAKKMRKSRHFIPIAIGLSVLIIGLLFEYNQTIASNIVAYISPGDSEVTEIQAIDPTVTAAVHESPTLMIPKLNIEVPIIMESANDIHSMQVAMLDGVANFKTSVSSAMPGEVGNFAISGHSAGNIYDTRSRYKFIFSGLTRMEAGDMIYVDYNGSRYSYRVQGAVEVEPTNVQELANISKNNPGKPMITLITCTPLGTSRYRLLVYAEQVYPDYGGAAEAEQIEATENESMEATQNSATPMNGFWNWLVGN